MAEIANESRPQQADGRKRLYVYLPFDLSVSLKKLALDEGKLVNDLVEEAVRRLLQARQEMAGTGGDA